MATAAALRAILGNRVRFFIDLTPFVDNSLVGARWECGCYAEGRGFAELRARPCGRHRDAIPEEMVQ